MPSTTLLPCIYAFLFAIDEADNHSLQQPHMHECDGAVLCSVESADLCDLEVHIAQQAIHRLRAAISIPALACDNLGEMYSPLVVCTC